MKAILEFNLPEDQAQFQMAILGSKMYSTLLEMDKWLRKQYKYMPDSEYNEDAHKAYETARNKLREFMVENNITLD
jgi:hypothetical protein